MIRSDVLARGETEAAAEPPHQYAHCAIAGPPLRTTAETPTPERA
jgi:hypothetical protein